MEKRKLIDLIGKMHDNDYIKVAAKDGVHFVHCDTVGSLKANLDDINEYYLNRLKSEHKKKEESLEKFKKKYQNATGTKRAVINAYERKLAAVKKSIENYVRFENRPITEVFYAAKCVDDVDERVLTVYVEGHESGKYHWVGDKRNAKCKKH